jgi:pantoate--beta-alanine ligase
MTAWRDAMTGRVGLVPTMGYLHEGHLSLVRRSRRDCDNTIVSIFVNPTQFGADEGVDAVFMPTVEEMYPLGFDDWVEVHGPVAERLEGEHRPGHFRGVTTIVARLFRIVQPDRAYFGQKDAQQLRVIRRMTAELALPVDVIGLPTVREPDGLAMSSRNVFLSPEERTAALVLSRALRYANERVLAGDVDSAMIKHKIAAMITAEPAVALEYVSISDEITLEELLTVIYRPALLLLAARVGPTRLIDNAALIPPGVTIPDHLKDLA